MPPAWPLRWPVPVPARVAGDDAFIERVAVERLAAGAGVGDDWNDRYEGMLAYAAKKGWLDDDGAVQAHIEWS